MKSQYILTDDGKFIIDDYNHAKTFSNFFPGVAGEWGIPMWVFYVNRGQGICSYGIESKDKAILEFQPANKAYRHASTQGFRTFLKVSESGKKTKLYEPFQTQPSSYKVTQRMIISSHDMTIEEVNSTLGLTVRVNYYTIPEENYPGLVRQVIIENNSSQSKSIEMVDGLPAINCYGIKDWLSKNLSRTIEAWVKVRNLKGKAPFYQLNVEVEDSAQVTYINEGNFYFAFDSSKKSPLLDPIVESSVVFGEASDLIYPEEFFKNSFKLPKEQFTSNRTPSAFVHTKFTLGKKGTKTICALSGYAKDEKQLKVIVRQATKKGYLPKKQKQNEDLVNWIKNLCWTRSASQEFNQYCGATFLDNVLRGGLPVTLETQQGPVVFNVFSRKHGDLERDYNFFTLAPTFLSQGNGNYRDVNQNRRNDIWFNPNVGESSVINFFNLSQADGYNPLIVKGLSFVIEDAKKAKKFVNDYVIDGKKDILQSFLQKGFMPGDLFAFIQKEEIKLKCSTKDFLLKVLGICQKQELADHGEGFWSDHWTYNLDIVESYLAMHPEGLKELLLNRKAFTYFHNDAYVLPRDQRFVLTDLGVRQYNAVKEAEDEIHAATRDFKLRKKNGEGEVYYSNLLVKLLCVIANKVATLDPSGIGVEMEGGKPNWYDALNGLPGLMGSSISETFEVKRYAQFLLEALREVDVNDSEEIKCFEELASFLQGLTNVLSHEEDALKYWKKSNDIKELYRRSVRFGIKGVKREVVIEDIKKFLQLVIDRCESGIQKAKNKQGLFATYFYHEITQYEKADDKHVRPLAFKRHDLPFFLEGFVHALRSETSHANAKKLFDGVRKSALYDKKLGMYKVNVDLSKETEEIGRTRIFPASWLENESVWLHMEYKYLLELLRCELYDEFYRDLETALIAFQPAERYGRSPLENSSFLVSSAHEDKRLHGQGFVARLSGSTAEFVHMWLYMNVGKKPFILNSNEDLQLQLQPALPGKWFTQSASKDFPANTYAFRWMATTTVVYHNPKRKNTYGDKGVRIEKLVLTYPNRKNPVELDQAILTGSHAENVRSGNVLRIDAYLA